MDGKTKQKSKSDNVEVVGSTAIIKFICIQVAGRHSEHFK
jgi:hypothetical protein